MNLRRPGALGAGVRASVMAYLWWCTGWIMLFLYIGPNGMHANDDYSVCYGGASKAG